MSITCKKVINIIEQLAPTYLAESWDNVGLIIGDKDKEINSMLIALDPTLEVIDEAIKLKVDMIITHHPLLFSGTKSIQASTSEGAKIMKLIKHDIVLYSAHTNLDSANGGLNDYFAQKVHLNNIRLLSKMSSEKLYKIVVYVPIGHGEQVREAMCQAGAGHIGRYSHCTFSTKGTGTFMPLEGTDPYIGQQGMLEYVDEVRLETIVSEKHLSETISRMIEAHPYEETAYDVFKMEMEGKAYGTGRIGDLDEQITLKEYAGQIKKELRLSHITIVGDLNAAVKKVAVCNGSGMDYRYDALKSGADVYVTGDIKYHDALDMKESGLNLIDVGHFGSEFIVVQLLKGYLEKQLGEGVEVFGTKVNKEPFLVL